MVLTDTNIIKKINVITPIIIKYKNSLKSGRCFDFCVSFNLISFLEE